MKKSVVVLMGLMLTVQYVQARGVTDSRRIWKREVYPCLEPLIACADTHAPGTNGPQDATCQQMRDVLKCIIPELQTCDNDFGYITQVLRNAKLTASQPPRNCDFSGVNFPEKSGNGNGATAKP